MNDVVHVFIQAGGSVTVPPEWSNLPVRFVHRVAIAAAILGAATCPFLALIWPGYAILFGIAAVILLLEALLTTVSSYHVGREPLRVKKCANGVTVVRQSAAYFWLSRLLPSNFFAGSWFELAIALGYTVVMPILRQDWRWGELELSEKGIRLRDWMQDDAVSWHDVQAVEASVGQDGDPHWWDGTKYREIRLRGTALAIDTRTFAFAPEQILALIRQFLEDAAIRRELGADAFSVSAVNHPARDEGAQP